MRENDRKDNNNMAREVKRGSLTIDVDDNVLILPDGSRPKIDDLTRENTLTL